MSDRTVLTTYCKIRRFFKIAEVILSLVLLVLKILKHILNLIK